LTGIRECRRELWRLARAFMPLDKEENSKANLHSRSEEVK